MAAIQNVKLTKKLLKLLRDHPDIVVSIEKCENCHPLPDSDLSACICANYEGFDKKPDAFRRQLVGLTVALINDCIKGSRLAYQNPSFRADIFLSADLVYLPTNNRRGLKITLTPSHPGKVIRATLLELMARTNVPIGQCLANNLGEIVDFKFTLPGEGHISRVILSRSTVVTVNFLDEEYSFYTPEGAFNNAAFLRFIYLKEREFNERNGCTTCPICTEKLPVGGPFVYIETLSNGVPQDCYCSGCLLPWIRSHFTSPMTRARVREADVRTGIIPNGLPQMRFVPEVVVQRARGVYEEPVDLTRTQSAPEQSDDAEPVEPTRALTTMIYRTGRIMSGRF